MIKALICNPSIRAKAKGKVENNLEVVPTIRQTTAPTKVVEVTTTETTKTIEAAIENSYNMYIMGSLYNQEDYAYNSVERVGTTNPQDYWFN